MADQWKEADIQAFNKEYPFELRANLTGREEWLEAVQWCRENLAEGSLCVYWDSWRNPHSDYFVSEEFEREADRNPWGTSDVCWCARTRTQQDAFRLNLLYGADIVPITPEADIGEEFIPGQSS